MEDILCGLTTQSFGLGMYDIYLVKLIRMEIHYGQKHLEGHKVNMYMTLNKPLMEVILSQAHQFIGSGSSDVYLIKTDGNGIEQWFKLMEIL